MSFDDIVALKRDKEAQLEQLRAEIKLIARVEERHVRCEELKRRLGGQVTMEDLELLGKVLQEPVGQIMGAEGIASDGEVGQV
ncbi:MAG: hypothetical protein JSS66_05090 [Armatimonadetes bacterium]|nr:hypothetical protein [Armatimonadota bacterium]